MTTGAIARWALWGLVLAAAGLSPEPALGAHSAIRIQEEQAADDERTVRTLEVNDGDVLELHNIAGDVTITGTSGNELHIDARKRGGRRDSRNAIDVQIAQRAARVEVRTRAGGGNRSHGSVDYRLRVPAGMVLDVHTVSGDVKATNVHGRATLRAVSGDIVASGLEQLDTAETLSGDVRISSSTATGNASIKSTSGGVTIDGVTVDGLKVATVSGEVRLRNLSTTRLEVTSLSGDVQFSGPLSRTGRYTINSHSGDVRFQPGDQTGFELTAGSFSGSVHSALLLTMRNQLAGRGKRSVQGVVGDGAASVEITTFSGDITLLK